MPALSDSLLVAAGLGLALFALVRIAAPGPRTVRALTVGWAAVAVLLGASNVEQRLRASVAPSADRPLLERTDGYVSSQACQACHPDQHASWDASYHSSMTELPSDETVLAPFDGERLEFGHSYRPHRRGDEFWVTTDNPSWAEPGEALPVSRRIALVTGSHHQQLYWFERPGTRAVGRFLFFYRVPEQRWVPFHSALLTRSTVTLDAGSHWTQVCIRCHTTNGKPRTGSRPNEADTRVAELGIGCESCHGPGGEHVRANQNALRRYWLYATGARDETIVDPTTLSADRELDVCGQCHAVQSLGSQRRVQEWLHNGLPFRPGDRLADTRYIVDLRKDDPKSHAYRRTLATDPHFFEDRFWPDGVVNVSGREYQGVRDSPCYVSQEFTCTSCHQLHRQSDDPRSPEGWADDQLAADRTDAGACVGCHPALSEPEAVEAHTHHAASSPGSDCYNCHMANTAYGLLNATRSHYIESPDVRTQLETGRPNACNLCHLDRTLAWTADKLERWYGTPRPVLEDPEHARTAEGVLLTLRGDAGQRALAAWHLGWEPARRAWTVPDWPTPLLIELQGDPYEAVRVIAVRSLATQPAANEITPEALSTRKRRRRASAEVGRIEEAATLDPRVLERLLFQPDGQPDRARLIALLRARDDRRIFRAE